MNEQSLQALLDSLPDDKTEWREDTLKNGLILANAKLGAIEMLLNGEEVSDFMLSFGVVMRVADALNQINLLINFIPEGWEMPLGWAELVKQIRGNNE